MSKSLLSLRFLIKKNKFISPLVLFFDQLNGKRNKNKNTIKIAGRGESEIKKLQNFFSGDNLNLKHSSELFIFPYRK